MDAVLKSTLNKWWTTIGVLLLYLCFNGYSKTQGWHFILPGFKFDGFESRAAAMVAIIIISPLIYIFYRITRFFSEHKKDSKSIYLAFPVAFSSNISDEYSISTRYQQLFIFLFLIFPLISNIHFASKFWVGCLTLDYCMQWKGVSALYSNEYSYYKVTFFPLIEPIIVSVISIINVFFIIKMFFCARRSVEKNAIDSTDHNEKD